MLPAKPLEFVDFSGGITENFFQADPRRYESADNFYVEVDLSLRERAGIVPFSKEAAFLGSEPTARINSFFSFINGTQLIAGSGRSLHHVGESGWPEIYGVGTNQALQGGNEYSQVTYAEFQRQIYLTSDGLGKGILPSKIYRDENNNWVARTVGLPRAFVTGNYTTQSLLASCIGLANAIRTSMVLHLEDSLNASYVTPTSYQTTLTNLHLNVDKYSLSYLVAQTFDSSIDPEIPSPIPTPAPNATNEATLFDLVQALNLAYTHHSLDGIKNSQFYLPNRIPFYHQDILANAIVSMQIKGPGAPLANNARPDSLEEAAAMLDDLYQKWNWHRKAVNVHSPVNDPAQFDLYAPIGAKIGPIYIGRTAPTVTPDFGDLYGYANNLKYLYNYHISNQEINWGGHKQRDNANFDLTLEAKLPDCDNLDDMFLIVYWLRALYFLHTMDSTFTDYVNVQFSATAGIRNLTSVIRTDTGAAYIMPVGAILNLAVAQFFPFYQQYDGRWFYRTAFVSVSASGTATLDRSPTSTSATMQGQVTYSRYHGSRDVNGTQVTRNTNPSLVSEQMANSPMTVGTDIDSWMTLADELFSCFREHANNQLTHENSVQNAWWRSIGQVPTPSFFQPTTAFYGYAFFFSTQYKVEPNGIEYLVQGNPVFTTSLQLAVSYPIDYIIPDQNIGYPENLAVQNQRGNLITNLPVLSNTNETNYDLPNVKLNIYRTTDGGNTYYLLAQVPNGTTEYLDVINDTVPNPGDTPLTPGRQEIYTSGGVQGWDQPPVSKYIHILDGVTYYGAITDAGQYFPNRIVQALANSPDGSPLANYIDLPDALTGISSTRSNIIGLCVSSVHRITGAFNTLGQGGMVSEEISATVGCISAKSIVRTEIGVFFAGTDGFYYTDGYQIIKISIDLNKRYRELTASKTQTQTLAGAYDQITRRIHWAMKTSETDTDNSIIFVFYLDYGVKPAGVFTTMSNGLNFRPSSLVFQDGVLYMGHEKGAVLKMEDYTKYDALVDFRYQAKDWLGIYIPYDFKSASVDMGSIFQRKWLTKIHLVGRNYGNQAEQIWVIRDLNQTQAGRKAMAPINYDVNSRWGDARCVWGDPEFKWEYDGKLDLWRRFPNTVLRSDFMQVQITPSYGPVYVSSKYPEFANVLVDATEKTATLITPDGYTKIVWPMDVVGYEICFDSDNYQTKFPIIRLPESERISFNEVPASGVWYLKYGDDVVGALAYDATSGDVQSALSSITGLPGVQVTGDYTDGFVVTFNGVEDQPKLLEVVDSTLADGASDPVTTTVSREPLTPIEETLRFSDPDGLALDVVAPGTKWQILGYMKEQRSTLKSFVLHFAYLGQENQSYSGRSTSDGQGNGGYNP